MAVKISLIDRGFGILIKVRGETLFLDFLNAQNRFLHGHPQLDKVKYVLLDYSEVVDLLYSVKELESAADEPSDFPVNADYLIYCKNGDLQDIKKAWRTYLQNREKELHFFTDFADLEEWLSGRFDKTYKGFIFRDNGTDKEKIRMKMSWYFQEILELNVKAVEEARTDYLTGFYTRKNFPELFANEKNRMSRNSKDLSFLYCDIDHFKRINNQFGIEAGDVVLKHVAEILRSNLRRYDSIWRWSGEEFLIMLPEASLKNAERIANKLRLILEQTIIFHENRDIQISMSFGVGTLAPDESPDHLLNRLYYLLRSAKENGAHTVVSESTAKD